MAREKDEKGKAEKSAKRTSKKWKAYNLSGGSLSRKLRSCPKCGDGVYLAQHHDRVSCGKCGYTEFVKKEKAGA